MLAEALRARGAKCIAIESSAAIPKAMRARFNSGVFHNIIQHQTDINVTLDAVKFHAPAYVVAGSESGVELAEKLGRELGLPVNGASLPGARRDKSLMSEAVRAQGLRTAVCFLSNNIEEITDWIKNTLDWPVILKPPCSVASDSVFCCRSKEEVRTAATVIMSGNNVLGENNMSVLVQEYLAGIEYAVDTVSYRGERKTTAIWQYGRPATPTTEKFICYDSMTLLPYTGERQQELQSYVYSVLDALSIQFGPAHCEIMWVDGEPVLIEAAARLSGGINALLSGICGGISQLDETVEAILDPKHFLATRSDQPCLQRRAVNLFLIPEQQGRLVRVQGLEEIRCLPTLHSLSVSAQPGDRIKRVAGLVTLIDEDIQAIERDISRIRAIESKGMFEVEN